MVTNIFLAVFSALTVSRNSVNNSLHEEFSHLSEEERYMIENANIENYEDLLTFVENNVSQMSANNKVGKAITNPKSELESEFSEYRWVKTKSKTTDMVSNAIPINVQDELFPKEEVLIAKDIAGSKSKYGGCGPIAMLGILDYFARYMGFKEIIDDVFSSEKRIELAVKVFQRVKTYETSDKVTITLPHDYCKAFNSLMHTFGLGSYIKASYYNSIVGDNTEKFYNEIVSNVENGLPVTFFSGIDGEKGDFAAHYSTIYGFEEYTGVKDEERVSKKFILGRLNFQKSEYYPYDNYYCDSDILHGQWSGVIYYNVKYNMNYTLNKSSFANTFVNENNQGQYYFVEKEATVTSPTNEDVNTKRLRCSFIENNYLVLSPNRSGAGIAYLDLELSRNETFLTFYAGLWGSSEGILYEKFYIQYLKDGEWVNHIEFDLRKFSTDRDLLDEYKVFLPKGASNVRFYAVHSNPTGDRNKGRIVLAVLNFQYVFLNE